MGSVENESLPKVNQLQRHSLLRESMKTVFDGARQSILDLQDMVLFSSSKEGLQSIKAPSNDTNNLVTQNKQSFVFEGELLTLKVLFIDIFVILCALISDFVQASSILYDQNRNDNEMGDIQFAVYAYIIIWIPGIPAAVHYLSVFRHRVAWYKSLCYALLIFLFYPIVPIIAKLRLIWMQPPSNKVTKEYLEAEYSTTVAYAIYGCISSPIQLCYQSWLLLNGIVAWDLGYLKFTIDWGSNDVEITWPSTPLCLIFSILTILKTTWAITTINLDPMQSWKEVWTYVVLGLKHLPFSITTSFFRISSMIMLFTYLNQFGLIPIVVFWIVTLVILVKCVDKSVEESSHNSTWLISFIALFVPAYCLPQFTEKILDQKNILMRQRKIFQYQTMAAFICYFPLLLVCLVITNIPCNHSLCYNYQINSYPILLNNYEFNCIICMIISEGIISNILAWSPTFSLAINNCSQYLCTTKKNSVNDDEQSVHHISQVYSNLTQYKDEKLSFRKQKTLGWKYAIILLLSLTPFICGTLFMVVGQEEEIDAYIYFNNNCRPHLRGTLISSKKYKIISGSLYPYDSTLGPIIASTILRIGNETENDIANRFSKANAVIIYEEDGKERSSTPLPYNIVKLYKSKSKPVVIRVKHGGEKLTKKYPETVAISFQLKPYLDEIFQGNTTCIE